jgi:hypothetical protein
MNLKSLLCDRGGESANGPLFTQEAPLMLERTEPAAGGTAKEDYRPGRATITVGR